MSRERYQASYVTTIPLLKMIKIGLPTVLVVVVAVWCLVANPVQAMNYETSPELSHLNIVKPTFKQIKRFQFGKKATIKLLYTSDEPNLDIQWYYSLRNLDRFGKKLKGPDFQKMYHVKENDDYRISSLRCGEIKASVLRTPKVASDHFPYRYVIVFTSSRGISRHSVSLDVASQVVEQTDSYGDMGMRWSRAGIDGRKLRCAVDHAITSSKGSNARKRGKGIAKTSSGIKTRVKGRRKQAKKDDANSSSGLVKGEHKSSVGGNMIIEGHGIEFNKGKGRRKGKGNRKHNAANKITSTSKDSIVVASLNVNKKKPTTHDSRFTASGSRVTSYANETTDNHDANVVVSSDITVGRLLPGEYTCTYESPSQRSQVFLIMKTKRSRNSNKPVQKYKPIITRCGKDKNLSRLKTKKGSKICLLCRGSFSKLPSKRNTKTIRRMRMSTVDEGISIPETLISIPEVREEHIGEYVCSTSDSFSTVQLSIRP